MSDRERMKEIVRREFHRTRLLRTYPVDTIVDRLIAAGFGDVAAARREALEEAANIAKRYAEQSREAKSKASQRAAKLHRFGDPFGHGDQADSAAFELDAALREAEAIESAIRALIEKEPSDG